MDIRLTGTGGPRGWPEPGCGCAPCARARRGGARRRPAAVVLDETVALPPPAAAGAGPRGYRIAQLPGGWDVTAPDGGRLLLSAGPGAVPEPPEDSRPYHAALLDLAGDPAQLGLLRRRALVTADSAVALLHIDHRVRSEQELTRRCGFWRVSLLADGSRITVSPGGASKLSTAPGGTGGPGTVPGTGEPWRVLLLGGARSGKSAEAELRLAAEPEVTYLATGPAPAGDQDWAARVAAHRARRPRWWRTVETLDLAGELLTASGAVLVDGIGTWLAATMGECGIWAALDAGAGSAASRAAGRRLAECISGLAGAWRHTRAHVVAISDEAGSGVIPATAAGRRFRDELGHLNQLLAAESDDAALVVAGRVLPLPA